MALLGGRLTLTSSHSLGSWFPVGETLVQYTATDAAGNSRTCNLTITVQGNGNILSTTWLKHNSIIALKFCNMAVPRDNLRPAVQPSQWRIHVLRRGGGR